MSSRCLSEASCHTGAVMMKEPVNEGSDPSLASEPASKKKKPYDYCIFGGKKIYMYIAETEKKKKTLK